jgi:hypothetical protein
MIIILSERGGMSGEMLNVLAGCLDSNTVHASEQRLKELSEHPEFTTQLLLLIPNQRPNILVMILSTLKNYFLARYNSIDNRVLDSQKDVLRGNLFDFYYQIRDNPNAV